MLICLFTVLKQLPHWKCLFSISSKKSFYEINKCLLLLPTIWLLVCLEVGKLKPREINIFNRSSNHWKWWNLWCPKRCWSPWVWEYMGASARWCDSSETAAQILPCIHGAALSGASTVSMEICSHSVQPKGIPTSRPALLAPICAYGLKLQCRLGWCCSFSCSLVSRHHKPAWPGASAAPEVSPQCWQGPHCLQPLHRQGVEGKELCLWCFPTCGSQS